MKNNTVWFAPGSYGVMAGVTMLLANVGSVLASGPSAAVLRWLSWRDLFAAAGMVSLVLAVGVYLVARDLPEHAGFSPVVTLPRPHQHRSNRPKLGERSLRGDLNRVRTIRGLWPAFWAAIGTNATFYAFAGLWGIPLLTDGFGLPNSDAALYTTLGLLAYGIASFVIGLYSDRLGRRKPLIIAASVAAVVGWLALGVLPWSPGWSGLALYLLVGLAGCQVVVAFANVKELVPTRLAATALAVVNFGVFLGAALIETLFGSILDTLRRGTSTGPRHYPLSDYRAALWLPIAVSVLGLLMSLRCRETRSRNHDDLSRHGSTASAPAGSSAASSSAAATSNPSSSGPGSTTTS
jgi:sugar phosphate permease